MMRRLLILTLALLALSACAAPAEVTEPTPDPPARETPEESAPEEPVPERESPEETEDRVLLTLEATLADGRALRLEAVGKVEDEYTCGVREVRVYDGEALTQTVQAREGNLAFWGTAIFCPARASASTPPVGNRMAAWRRST